MKLSYALRPADFVATLRLQTRPVFLAAIWAGVIFGAALLGNVSGGGSLLAPYWLVPAMVLGAVLGGVILACFWWAVVIPVLARRFQRQNSKLYPAGDMTLDAEGIQFVSPIGTARLGWSDFQGFRENRKLFLLEASRSVGIPISKIPLRPEQIDQVRDFIAAKLRRL